MIPTIPNKAYYRLNIPELSGGVNLRDNISLIQDNQLTDCRNAWYKDGMLRTRPGIRVDTDFDINNYIYNYAPGVDSYKVYADENNFVIVDGVKHYLVCLQYDTGFGTGKQLVFRYYNELQDAPQRFIEVATINESQLPKSDFNCNIFQHGNDAYCFCSGYYEDENIPFYIFKISRNFESKELSWNCERITEERLYIPTVLINGQPTNLSHDSVPSSYSTGELLEGYNLLGRYYTAFYSSAIPSDEKGTAMRYILPQNVGQYSVLTVEITYANGNKAVHTVNIDADIDENFGEKQTDGYRIAVSGREVCFYTDDNFSQIATQTGDDYLGNNIKITAAVSTYMENDLETIKNNHLKVLNTTFNKWYGGDSEGIYGGVQLFLGGNTDETEKNIVLWSDVDKPLYFSENCYAYVGDKSQRVTAFGQQGEALIIAKEKELYATQYINNSEAVNQEAVTLQTVVDVVANEAVFPMTKIHGYIGCDCPHTMQLCRNRLVWANSDGKVYTLVSASNYTERSVYEVSGMIEREFGGFSPFEIRKALSSDWNGYYTLLIGNKLFLMDYNSYGFANVYSHTKTEDAQVRIPWWIWELPEMPYLKSEHKRINVCAMMNMSERLYFPSLVAMRIPDDSDYAFPMTFYFDTINADDIYPFISGEFNGMPSFTAEELKQMIPTMAKTKFFDFGIPTIKKSVPKVEVVFGAAGGNAVRATVFIDDNITESIVVVDEAEAQAYSENYFQNKLIRPTEKHAYRIGLKFESNGNMALDSITLQYKQLGGLK